MARTAPIPNIPAIPGMNPGVFVLGGGAGSGGGSGDGSGGAGSQGAGGSNGGNDASGGGKEAPDPNKYPECGTKSHPVDVVTGRAFTHPIIDFALPGPLPLVFARVGSSKAAALDAGLGRGWAHTLGWQIEVLRRAVRVWTDQGTYVDFPVPKAGESVVGPWAWVLRRDGDRAFSLDADEDGTWRRFEPADERGDHYRLSSVEDRNANRIVLSYDQGRLFDVTDSAGRTIRVETTAEGRITSFALKDARSPGSWIDLVRYAYDERGLLARVTDADGFSARYAYDDEGRLAEDTDRTGLTFHFVYDPRTGRCTESWGDYGDERDPSLAEGLPAVLANGTTRAKGIHHCRFDYFRDHYSEVADSTQVARFFGNERGTLAKRCEGPGVWLFDYDARGFLTRVEDPCRAETRFVRDERGKVLRSIDPLGRTADVRRDDAGRPVEITDPAGGITSIQRDRFGNAIVVKDATGSVTSYERDARGLVTTVCHPNGARTRLDYDAEGNLVRAVQPNGGAWQYAYDALGRRLSATDPVGAVTRYAYSARGDLIAVTDAAGGVTRYAYDGEGHLTQVVNPAGYATDFEWGGYHRLCARKDANGHVVRLRYNREGELLEVQNEVGEVHRLHYDLYGRLVGEETFDGRELRYRLDPCGRPSRIETQPGCATLLEYDLAGQLVSRELPDDDVERFEYDTLGALIRATNKAGETFFERDREGRVVAEIQKALGVTSRVDVVYDALGERVERRTSRGHVERIERDAMGSRVRTLLDGGHVVGHENDLFGRERARVLSDGGIIESAYDPLGRLAGRRVSSPVAHKPVRPGEPDWIGARHGAVSAEKRYRYDAADELAATWDLERGATRYEYDPIGQLLAAVPEKAQAEVFRYDPAGNVSEAGPASRLYGKGNRLLRKGDTEYVWDAEGRLSEKRERKGGGATETTRYEWSGAGLLQKVRLPDGAEVDFGYDPFARRLYKRVSRPRAPGGEVELESVTRFVWDGDVLVHEIRERAGAAGDPVIEERTYCFEDRSFVPLAHRDGGEWFQYVNDPIGTPERLVDARGEVVEALFRGPWGLLNGAQTDHPQTPLRLPGQYADEEVGLSYSRFRYYDASLGLFISSDPIGLSAGTKFFAYPRNTFKWIDPFGLVFARQYSLEEVQAMLASSEGRASPATGMPGHAQSEHVQVPRQKLQQRSCNGGRKTGFSSSASQAQAVQTALNSPQGQAQLAQLDANPATVRAGPITAPLAWPVTMSQSVDGSRPERVTASSVTVIADRLPGPGEQLHIQTAFGR